MKSNRLYSFSISVSFYSKEDILKLLKAERYNYRFVKRSCKNWPENAWYRLYVFGDWCPVEFEQFYSELYKIIR